MRFERLLTAVFVLLLGSVAWPQTPKPNYDPRLTFAPLTLPDPVNAYRSSNGAPGPAYWQNEADYEMHAELDTQAKILHNDEVITYTNAVLTHCTSLWIHWTKTSTARIRAARSSMVSLRQTRCDSATAADGPPRRKAMFLIRSKSSKGPRSTKADYVISDTRMQMRLPQPLAPKGRRAQDAHQVSLSDSWRLGRTHIVGRVQARERSTTWRSGIRACASMTTCAAGTRCLISAASFTWNTESSITTSLCPANMIVAGSGELMNPKEVLTKKQIERLASSAEQR